MRVSIEKIFILRSLKEVFSLSRKCEICDKGVKIHSKENQLFIELYIIVEYGTKISVIANNIIQKIRYNVENYTGLKVAAITVNVQGVRV